jgi:hypothetical protein
LSSSKGRFVWTSEYSVTVTQVGGETVVSQNVTTTSFVCPTLVNGTTYQWSLSASNQAGSSTEVSAVFTIELPTAPAAPTGLTPGAPTQPGQKVTSATPTLSWTASPGATKYFVLVEQVGGATLVNQTVTTNSIVCPALTSGATYQWFVTASNSAGSSLPSATAYISYQPGQDPRSRLAILSTAQTVVRGTGIESVRLAKRLALIYISEPLLSRDTVHGRPSGGCGDSSAEREFPSDKVYRRDDRGIVGVESSCSLSLTGPTHERHTAQLGS